MATATSFVSREQPSIADDPKLTNAFYDAPTVITLFAPKNFLFSVDDCAVAAENMMLAADALGIGSCYIGQDWPAFAAPYGRRFCGSGIYLPTTTPSCSCFWLRQRGRQTPHPEAEKRGARDPDGRCCEMNAQICLEKLKLCGVLSFATVDKTAHRKFAASAPFTMSRIPCISSRQGARRFVTSC